jgi:hypothetical protein
MDNWGPYETVAKLFEHLWSDSLEAVRTPDRKESILESSKMPKNQALMSKKTSNLGLKIIFVTFATVSYCP